jgi:hypothetical protein
VQCEFVGNVKNEFQNVAEITAGVPGEVRTFFNPQNPQILKSLNPQIQTLIPSAPST